MESNGVCEMYESLDEKIKTDCKVVWLCGEDVGENKQINAKDSE